MSQNQIVYHSVIPENNRATYSEFDVVDFRAQFPTRQMNLNSVRLTGTFAVTDQAGASLAAQSCQMDQLVGSHSFWSQIQTFVGGVSVDNILEYPRMVKMMTSASENPADMFNSDNLCELKAPCQNVAQELLRKEHIGVQQTAPITRDLDFSCKPMVSLNQVYGERRSLSYSKSGDVRMVVTLARNNAVLFGLDVVEGYSYELKDLRMEFTSYPDDGDTSTPIIFKRRQGLKQSFASQTAQLNFNFPMMSTRVYGSFLPQDDENQPQENNLGLSKPPNVSTLTFFWNNSTNEYISYQLRSQPEIIERYLDAIGDTGRNSASLANLANNNGYGCGIDMGEEVDLMSTKLSVVIESQLSSNNPMLLYLFAEGQGQM
jgi:hypothetical protein